MKFTGQCAVLAFAALVSALPCSAQKTARILLLNSYHQGYEWTDDIVRGVQDAVGEAGLTTELYIEYMDIRRHRGPAYYDGLAEYYKSRYSGITPDVIISSDDHALQFLIERRPHLFSKTPIVFCGVNDYNGTSSYATDPAVRQFATGVLEKIDVEETARLALRLHPGTKYIYTIGESAYQRYDLDLRRAFPQIITRQILNERLSMEEIGQQLSTLPSNSIVLLSAFSTDRYRRQLSMAQSAEFVASRSIAPVYGINRNTLGRGIVGGKLTDGYSQGVEAAKIARKILSGISPADIPIRADGTNPYVFDYQQLQRWGVAEDALPSRRVVVGLPQSLYEQYKSAIQAYALFVIFQAVVIALLVANMIRRRRSERALQHSRQELARQVRDFETLLEVIPIGIAVADDPECRSIRFNPAFAEILGVSPDENAWKTRSGSEALPFRVYRHGEEVPDAELPMQIAAREGSEVRGFELDIVRADGRVIHQFGHATPLFDEGGRVRGSIGTFVDISERNRAEAALRDSESRFRQLADSMPQIVWTAGPDGRIDYYNRRWYEFTGLPQGRGGAESWKPILHSEDVERCLDAWYTSVRSGEQYQTEYRFWHKETRSYRWQLGRALPVKDAAGKIVKWFGTSTDIDDQKEIEAALRRANQDLEQFAFSASHDLQEPLRNVSIYSQLLGRSFAGKLNEDADQFLAYIIEGARRMETLLKGLLAYTQVEAGGDEPVSPVDGNEVLTEVERNLNVLLRECQAVVTADPLPVVCMNRVHLGQMFQNLISNAVKFRGSAPPRIHISAAWGRGFATLSVQDNGIGIDPQYQKQIFGIFKRLYTRDRYPGAGIGLSICQKIVERYGGRIWVESEPGEGATFRFSVPVQEEQNVETAERTEVSPVSLS